MKIPELLLLSVMSGVHSAPDSVPEVCVMDSLVTLAPAAPGVEPYDTPGFSVRPFVPPVTLMLAGAPETSTNPPAPPPPGPWRLASVKASVAHALPPLPPFACSVRPLSPPLAESTTMVPPAPPPPPASLAVPL